MARPKKLSSENLELPEAVRQAAWKQITEKGASALNLRAIARELNVTAPAIYNYFPRRDDLVTALINEAFTSFGDWQIAARDALPATDHAGRLKAIGLAYRRWAHAYPQRYQLIFGAPIPGYVPPMGKLKAASTHAISGLFSVVEGMRLAGVLNFESFQPVQTEYARVFEMWREHVGEVHPATHFAAMIIWSRVHGMVSLEIQGNLPPFGENGEALYLVEIEAVRRQFLLEQGGAA